VTDMRNISATARKFRRQNFFYSSIIQLLCSTLWIISR